MGRLVFNTSMARLPTAATHCRQEFSATKQNITFQCASGTIKTPADEFMFGWITGHALIEGLPEADNRAYNDFCGNETKITPAETNCYKDLDSNGIRNIYHHFCFG